MPLKKEKTSSRVLRSRNTRQVTSEFVRPPIVEVQIKCEPLQIDKKELLEVLQQENLPQSDESKTRKSNRNTPKKKPTTNKSCALCLRQYQEDLFVKITRKADGTALNATECEKKLKKAVDLKLNLEHHVVCQTCWALVETLTDFRECCSKVESLMKNPDRTSYVNESDPWFSNEAMESITYTRRAIQFHSEHLGMAESSEQPSVVYGEHIKIEPLIEFYECENEDDGDNVRQDTGEHSDKYENEPEQTEKMEIEVLTCEQCSRRFDSKTGYTRHQKFCDVTNPKRRKRFVHCSICSASFKTARLLEFHLNKHKGIKPYKCRKTCDNFFYSPHIRLTHEKYCGQNGVDCPICGETLKNRFTLAGHLGTHGVANIPCPECGNMFKSQKTLSRHLRVHTKVRKYGCKLCDKTYKTSNALKVHMRIHTKEKPYVCKVCKMKFMYQNVYAAHVACYHGTD